MKWKSNIKPNKKRITIETERKIENEKFIPHTDFNLGFL